MTAQSDEKYLRETLEILFNNAFKFTRGRADGRIEFGSRANHGETLFYVNDNGVGYDPEYAARLFSPFQRLHSPDDFPGEGMGLAMARKIVRRLGGRIWAEAEVDRGATFFFTLG
jgi:light-regulated signal transduction histidine kinase (bacteriophytochrome)